MKIETTFTCEKCGEVYGDYAAALKCENSHQRPEAIGRVFYNSASKYPTAVTLCFGGKDISYTILFKGGER